jgi:glutathione S-transferase
VLTLYQAEWCPYSSAVRQRLTELGIDFVAKQVAPRQEERDGEHEIPLLVTEDGEQHEGTRAVFEYLRTLSGAEWETEHRERYADHANDRREGTTAQVLEKLAPLEARSH